MYIVWILNKEDVSGAACSPSSNKQPSNLVDTLGRASVPEDGSRVAPQASSLFKI